ncbi:MAG: OmpA family protein [Chitinophagales bacterium]|nr:OmpA family protein [Chitinophagales bacterium]
MMLSKRIFFFILLILLVGSCTTSNKIHSGKEAFLLKRYALAVPLLETEFHKAKDDKQRAEIALMIAESLDYANQYEASEKWYKIYKDNSIEQEASLIYAKALMRNEKYVEAQSILEQYLKINRQDRKIVEPLINTCIYVQKEGKNDLDLVKVTPFVNNSDNSDFDANIIGDDIIFSSTRIENDLSLKTDWNNEGYASLWKVNLDGNKIEKYNTFDEKYHVASLTTTEDGKTIYFTQCGSDEIGVTDYCGIYRVKKENDKWTTPERIHIFGDTSNNGQAHISQDGKTLYFASDAPFGYGGKDLYSLQIQKDGTYGEPINLGSKVNTAYDEMFPFITPDGNTLFYSSNNINSFGGLDIFKATRIGRLFTNSERLPYGLNTGRDDFGLEIFNTTPVDTSIAFTGIISSNRAASKSDDLYFVEVKKSQLKEIAPAMYILEGQVVEHIYTDSLNPNSKVLGERNITFPNVKLSGELIPSDLEGFFTTQLDSGIAYQLVVQKNGYLTVNIPFSTSNIQSKPGDTIYFRQKVFLSKIYKDVEIVLNNIYYDFDKWDIRQDAFSTLDSLAMILKENEKISIEIAAHTDCRGNEEYNLYLSQKRAESVVKYLIAKGIDNKRLSAKGYGESMLLDKCPCEACTEEQHQQNRRTTFKILNEL